MFDKCAKLLADNQLTITFIESATAGYLSHQFSLTKPSGDILIGGLVCYDDWVKKNVLKVSSQIMADYTSESLEVTRELIKKSKAIFESDVYVACTGLVKAGGSETEEKPVGTFFYCIGYKDEIYDFHSFCAGSPNEKMRDLSSRICKSIIEVVGE